VRLLSAGEQTFNLFEGIRLLRDDSEAGAVPFPRLGQILRPA
jgi:hypothetical protein